jgi:hypothetical protein
MKNNNFTKKQLETIENLECDLDELSNKPHRLFESLRDFAQQFVEDEEKLKISLGSLDEFQRLYYQMLRLPGMSDDIIRAGMEVNKELIVSEYDLPDDYKNGYEEGCKDATKAYCKKILDNLTEYLF